MTTARDRVASFAGGIAATTGVAATHPLDVLKTRAQLFDSSSAAKTPSLRTLAKNIVRKEGVGVFWRGVGPAVLRALSYGSLRLGLYEPIRHSLGTFVHNQRIRDGKGKDKDIHQPGAFINTADPGVVVKVLSGLSSGALAAAICNPLDLLKVRLSAAQTSTNCGKVHTTTGDQAATASNLIQKLFLSRPLWWGEASIVVRDDGIFGFWRGTYPAAIRAALLTAGQLAVYDSAKTAVRSYTLAAGGDPRMADGVAVQVSAAMLSGLVTTSIVAPADVVKTRLQGPAIASARYHCSALKCLLVTWREEGIRGLFRGWTASYMRQGPQTFIVLLTMEKIRRWAGREPI